jgi:hypothetical protein
VDFRQSLIDLRGAIDVTLKNWPAPSPAPPAQTGFFGRPLAPIGLNIADGTDWPVNSPMPNRAILEWAKSLGVNAVRVGFKIEAVQPTLGGALDPARIAEMKASLAIAAELGIAVLWDAHNYGRRPEGRWGYELPASDLANFWQRFAAAFTDRRAILGLWAHERASRRSSVMGSHLPGGRQGHSRSRSDNPHHGAGPQPLDVELGPDQRRHGCRNWRSPVL